MRGLVQVVQRVARRVQMLFGRGLVRAVRTEGGRQLVQASILAGETRSNLEHPQEYGFASVPLPGTEVLIAFRSGNRDDGVVIASADRRTRPSDLERGEVALYHASGSRVLLRANGDVVVESATQVVLSTPSTRIEGDLEVTGDVTDQAESGGLSMATMRALYNVHSHPSGSPATPQMGA